MWPLRGCEEDHSKCAGGDFPSSPDSWEPHSQALQQDPYPALSCQHKASHDPGKHCLPLLANMVAHHHYYTHKKHHHTPKLKPSKIYFEILTEFHQDHTSALCHWANSGLLALVWHIETPTPDVPISLHEHPDTTDPCQQLLRTLRDLQLTFLGYNFQLQVVSQAMSTTLTFQQ